LIVVSFSGFPPTPSSSSAQETRNHLPAKRREAAGSSPKN
jgi:hypothetical protein